MTTDLLSLARSALRQARSGVTVKVRGVHVAVARDAMDRARKELAELEATLRAEEAQLAIDGVSP